jgi:hypothetical protein
MPNGPIAQQRMEASRTIGREEMARLALACCKECRGWTNAHYVNDCGYRYVYENVSKELADTSVPPYERQFHYMHLDRVAKAVREWLMLPDITPVHHTRIFATIIPDFFSRYFVGSLDEAGLCYELMAACVVASRREEQDG